MPAVSLTYMSDPHDPLDPRSGLAQDAAKLLAATGLVTLTGPAGIGKTRLARAVAHELREPVHWVDLGGCRDAAQVLETVAACLGAGADGDADATDAVLRTLAGTSGVLVLDTCEHVRTGCAYLLGRLRESRPELPVLVTARKSMGLPGEHVVRLRPLPPDRTADLLQSKAAEEGVPLPDSWTWRLAAELDGDPLSALLTVRALRTVPAAQLLERLVVPGRRFDALVDGPARPARHRTLRAAVAWSHDLCPRYERLLWARLSAFTGAFTREQARTLFPESDALPGLVDDSVVLAAPDGSYRLPRAYREYGLLYLAELGAGADPPRGGE